LVFARALSERQWSVGDPQPDRHGQYGYRTTGVKSRVGYARVHRAYVEVHGRGRFELAFDQCAKQPSDGAAVELRRHVNLLVSTASAVICNSTTWLLVMTRSTRRVAWRKGGLSR